MFGCMYGAQAAFKSFKSFILDKRQVGLRDLSSGNFNGIYAGIQK